MNNAIKNVLIVIVSVVIIFCIVTTIRYYSMYDFTPKEYNIDNDYIYYKHKYDSIKIIISKYEYEIDSLDKIKNKIITRYEKDSITIDTIHIDSITSYISNKIYNR